MRKLFIILLTPMLLVSCLVVGDFSKILEENKAPLFILDENGYLKGNPDRADDMKEIEIPATFDNKPVKGIAADGFKNFDKIEKITLPASADFVKISEGAFYGCSNLNDVVFPLGSNSIKEVGEEAFSRCSSLVDIVLPDNIETFGNGLFWGCSSLESVEFGDNIKSIGLNIFSQCPKLETIKFEMNPEEVYAIVEDIYEEWYCPEQCNIEFGDYSFGDVGPYGGIVIYDCDADNESGNADKLKSDEINWRYILAAPSDCLGTYIFGYSEEGNDKLVGTSPLIGKGKENTESLYYGLKDVSTTAAYVSKNYDYNQWFLPSEKEMEIMVAVLKNTDYKLSNGSYWTSTEDYDTEDAEADPKVVYKAVIADPDEDGIVPQLIQPTLRSDLCKVRPIRYF